MRNTTASALSDYAQLLSRLEHQHKTFENTIVHPQKSSPSLGGQDGGTGNAVKQVHRSQIACPH